MCDPNEIDDGCPVDYVCEGQCCIPDCEEEGGLVVEPELLGPVSSESASPSWLWWIAGK